MKKRHLILLSIISGFLFVASWPDRGIPFLIFFAFVPLLYVVNTLISDERYKRASVLVYMYPAFFIWNLFTTWWIYISTDIGFIFAVFLNSLFMSLVFVIYSFTRKNVFIGEKAYITLILYWISFEYLHLDWDLSWSWLNLGNVFAAYPQVYQWYDITGTFGGTLWILLVNVLIYEAFVSIIKPTQNFSKAIRYSVLGIFVIVIPILFSIVKYVGYTETKNPFNIVVVQPNIDPYNEKFTGMSIQEQLKKMTNLTIPLIDSSTDYVAFPETSIPDGICENEININSSIIVFKDIIKNYPKLKIVIGASSLRFLRENETTATSRKHNSYNEWFDVYNSALQIDNSDSIQIYHKSKLVPGVEKMPFSKILKPLEKFAIKLGGMSGSNGVQKERTAFFAKDNDMKIAPVICYESIYGEFVTGYINKGAQLIFIITNDGWWDNTEGHRQHLQYARLRSVETRRSIARSANTGISAFINQRGDIIQKTKWWEPIAIKSTLNANDKITFYVKYGDYIGKISLIASLLLILYTISRKIIKRIRRNKLIE